MTIVVDLELIKLRDYISIGFVAVVLCLFLG